MRLTILFALLAGAVAARAQTAVIVGVRNLVVLELTAGAKDGCGPLKLDFVRSFPDGTAASEPFRVPPGRVLIVTDVDWHYYSGGPNLVQVLQLAVQNLGDAAKVRRVFESSIRLNTAGVGGTSEHMTTGFALSSQARICADVIPGPLGSPMRLSRILLRGYLVDEE